MRLLLFVGMFLLFVGAIAIVGADAQPGSEAAGRLDTPDCIHYFGEARYSAYGYNHIVHVVNRCESDARCEVSTDVNPDVQKVTVAAGETEEVVTFVGSPSREFTPYVSCTL